jgi:UPF0755 protein
MDVVNIDSRSGSASDVVQYNLTLVEGWNFHQVRSALAAQMKSSVRPWQALSDERADGRKSVTRMHIPWRSVSSRTPIAIVRGMTDADVLKQAFDRLEDVLDEEWDQRSRDVPYVDPYQALIMASLVEKETGVPHERVARLPACLCDACNWACSCRPIRL